MAGVASAQGSYNERAKKYVQDHWQYAIEEQRRAGIPAAITLAQGILETDAGTSELVVGANNHFGIKCKSDWQGETFAHDDDAPGECFKKYKSTLESYKDHSDLLHRNPRYAPLFKIDQKNYSGWAMCLRKCGYATNPQYGQRLIKVVEEFGLQEYTNKGLDNSFVITEPAAAPATQPVITNESGMASIPVKYEAPVRKTPVLANNDIVVPAKAEPATGIAKPAAFLTEIPKPENTKPSNIIVKNLDEPVASPDAPIKVMADSAWNVIMEEAVEEPIVPQAAPPRPDSGKIVTFNNLKAFYARKGESLLEYAVKYNVRYPVLLEMNDLPDAPLPFDTYVYLQKKHTVGLRNKHTVKPGETTLMIAQAEGMQIRRIRALNHLNENDEPVAGAVLELQGVSDRKPQVKTAAMPAHPSNAIRPNGDTSKAGYITLNRPKPAGSDTAHTFIGNQPTGGRIAPGTTQPRGIAVKPGMKPGTPLNPIDSAALAAKRPDTVYGIDEKRDWAAMHWVMADTVEKAVAIKSPKQSTVNYANAELTRLKAALDKIVYADNSGLITAEPQRTVASSASADKTYTVKKGDSAFSIARKHNITVDQLLKWNAITTKDIKVGKTLKISE
jgi:LysM repeat protein